MSVRPANLFLQLAHSITYERIAIAVVEFARHFSIFDTKYHFDLKSGNPTVNILQSLVGVIRFDGLSV